MALGNFSCFFVEMLIISKINFLEKIIRNTIRISIGLDPDQTQCFVRLDLGPNCLQRLSADGGSRERAKQKILQCLSRF